MKKFISLIFSIFITIQIFAQVPIIGAKLSDVKSNMEGVDAGLTINSLQDAIDNAIISSYDPTYYTAPATSLKEFRNYNHFIEIPLANIISRWKLNGNSLDEKGLNNGTDSNISYVTGKIGQGASFNGSSSKIGIGNNASIQISTGAISLLVKTSGAGSGFRALVVKRNAYGIWLKDDVVISYSYGDVIGEKNTGVDVGDNTWHHIVMTFDSTVANGLKIYVDGILKVTDKMSITSHISNLNFGVNETIEYANAVQDDVILWDRPLSQAEVTALSTAQLAGTDIEP